MSLLPNAEFAFVPLEKLTGYVLNPEHPVGKHKAAVFETDELLCQINNCL